MLVPGLHTHGLISNEEWERATRRGARAAQESRMRNTAHRERLNYQVAMQYAKAIEAQGVYWTGVHAGGSVDFAVLEIRSRQRPLPILRRCLTVQECVDILGHPLDDAPAGSSVLTRESLVWFARQQKERGMKSYPAEKLARQSGHRVGRHEWRQLWGTI